MWVSVCPVSQGERLGTAVSGGGGKAEVGWEKRELMMEG